MAELAAAALPRTEATTRARTNIPVLIVLAIIAFLLAAIVAMQGYALYSAMERADRVAAAAKLQRDAVTKLQSDCEQAIYHDPDTKGAIQQQFRVSECTLQATELLAIQSSQIIELT